jgi:hypothetical protein
VFALLVVEVGLRLLGMDQPRVWVPDPVVGWHHLPGAQTHMTDEGDGQVVINSLGYRDRERQLDKAAETFRIAVFGDSMVEATQVNLDKTFTYLLEERLSSASRPVEVLNFGIAGYGPLQELLLFQREGPRYRPDLVVLAVFLDNDVADCHPALRTGQAGIPFARVENGNLQVDYSRAEQNHASYHREPIYSVRKYSALYRAFREFQARRAGRSAADGPTGAIPRRFQLYQEPAPPDWDEAWSTLDAVLGEFAAEARRQQVPLMVVSVPCSQVVNDAAWQKTLQRHPAMADATWDLEQAERRLRQLAQKYQLPLLQPYLPFRQAGQAPPLYFGVLGHFTPRGHELMADALDHFLREQRLLP